MSDVSHNLNSIKIENIQNISLFIIACSSFFSYLYYNLAPLWYENNGGGEGNISNHLIHYYHL